MRFGLFTSLLCIIVLCLALVLPVPPARLSPLPGRVPPPPIVAHCLTLTYSGTVRPEVLPHRLELLPHIVGVGRRARGDGDPLWDHVAAAPMLGGLLLLAAASLARSGGTHGSCAGIAHGVSRPPSP